LNYLLVVVLALSFAATGCRKKPKYLTPLPGQTTRPIDDRTAGLPDGYQMPGGTDVDGGLAQPNLEDFGDMTGDRAALAAHTIYFDYDSAAVKSSEKSKVQAVADALKSDFRAKVLVEGHCDERGTEEYNRALGERRALSVRQALAKQGVDASRVRTLSYGEDRPATQGHDEAAWRMNRRAEFVLLHPKL
jgi:peptidoglycan-associated lipoprotein